jgi:hypothetical protein
MFVVKRVQKVAALPRQDDTVGNKLRRHSVVRCLEELSVRYELLGDVKPKQVYHRTSSTRTANDSW